MAQSSSQETEKEEELGGPIEIDRLEGNVASYYSSYAHSYGKLFAWLAFEANVSSRSGITFSNVWLSFSYIYPSVSTTKHARNL